MEQTSCFLTALTGPLKENDVSLIPMLTRLYQLASPVLFAAIPPETAHGLTLAALKTGLFPKAAPLHDPALEVTLWERKFPNPVGLAAGFDKNAEAIAPLLSLGFGFVETGTVTPRSQPGNPKPRIFRAPAQKAVINRMGFPGGGAAVFKDNFQKFLEQKPRPAGMVGINIGMNKDQDDPAKDYCALVRTLGPLADYLAVNISSPNTPGLRQLQTKERLLDLLGKIMEERKKSCGSIAPPLLVKFAPDLDERQKEAAAAVALDAGIDGLILTNTTLARPETLPSGFAQEAGGLSGAPLKDKATETIRDFYRLTDGKVPIVGVGGVSTGRDAYEKIRAGASLVQLYTGLVYRGPWVAELVCRGLLGCLKADGFTHVSQAVGADQPGSAGMRSMAK